MERGGEGGVIKGSYDTHENGSSNIYSISVDFQFPISISHGLRGGSNGL